MAEPAGACWGSGERARGAVQLQRHPGVASLTSTSSSFRVALTLAL